MTTPDTFSGRLVRSLWRLPLLMAVVLGVVVWISPDFDGISVGSKIAAAPVGFVLGLFWWAIFRLSATHRGLLGKNRD